MVRRINTFESRKRNIKESDGEFIKITAPTAKKMFANGETVYLLPNKVRLGNAWIPPFAINDADGITFDKHINAYKYYNCNKETGNGIAYYKFG